MNGALFPSRDELAKAVIVALLAQAVVGVVLRVFR